MSLERPGYKLTAEAEADYVDFEAEDTVCSCHISPPCGHCTHPGNPTNLEEDDSAWEPEEFKLLDGELGSFKGVTIVKNIVASGDIDALGSERRYFVVEPERQKRPARMGGKSLQMLAALMAANVPGHIFELSTHQSIEDLVEEVAGWLPEPKTRVPKQPNPEIQTTAEAKRQRRLERNKRIAK